MLPLNKAAQAATDALVQQALADLDWQGTIAKTCCEGELPGMIVLLACANVSPVVLAIRRSLVNLAVQKRGWDVLRVPFKLNRLLALREVKPTGQRYIDGPDPEVRVDKSVGSTAIASCLGFSKGTCAYCDCTEAKLRTCGACGSVWYCSTDCQRTHWRKSHRWVCGLLAAPITPGGSVAVHRDAEVLTALTRW
jgi:hypothetical protein